MPRPYTVRELMRALRDYDAGFYLDRQRGKGSHRSICHPARVEMFTIPYHGEGTVLGPGYISAVIRRFKLPKGVL